MSNEAFERLWRDHYRAVVRTAYLIVGDLQEAQELSQEAFARAFQHWRRVSTLERPEAWVHRVATNLAISSARRLVARGEPSPSVPEPDAPDEELRRALLDLPPAQRATIALRFYLDWSVDQVADSLGKRPGTIRALTHQGLSRLRETILKESRDG